MHNSPAAADRRAVSLRDAPERRDTYAFDTPHVLVSCGLLGVVTSYTLGGMIHILLVVSIVVVLLRVIQGRNPLRG